MIFQKSVNYLRTDCKCHMVFIWWPLPDSVFQRSAMKDRRLVGADTLVVPKNASNVFLLKKTNFCEALDIRRIFEKDTICCSLVLSPP